MPTKTRTALMMEYGELSKDFSFPDEIECALERDYAANPVLYDLGALKSVSLVLLIASEISAQEVLDHVRAYRQWSIT
ncbi:hypothetical protein LJR129_004943 [Acidovorax sp. LjRoot129]|uniref:hypothetical protein n=1 Tax=unclassified Acidovorax TaxID=2684926 RepID=UPI003ED0BDEC